MAEPDPAKDVMETKAQVDPFMREGRISTAWVLIVAAIVIAAIAVTFAVTTRSPQTAQNQPTHSTQPSARHTSAPSATTTGSRRLKSVVLVDKTA